MKILFTLSTLVLILNASITLPKNFETDFNQTITNDKNRAIHYRGKVSFKQEKYIIVNEAGDEREIGSSFFKWNYTDPTKKEVCTDGIQLTVIDHDLEQVSKYLINEGIDLEKILNVAEQISTKDYKATYKEVEYLITLDEKGQLKKIVYVDTLDNRVKIIFEKMEYNIQPFDDNDVKCPAQADYDVIEG
ncbi:MAG TPA: hypothetical protein EYG90_01775 [Campylobacterales bacterium]|nr:hypothetical protein [Campylobacterales bacterium]